MALHTKGPWAHITSHDKRGDGYIREAAPHDEAGRRLAICKVTHTGRTWDEAQANARLIAAAPALLDALCDMLSEFDADEFGSEGQMQVCAAARDALARATGEA